MQMMNGGNGRGNTADFDMNVDPVGIVQQGQKIFSNLGASTCALTSVASLLTQSGKPTTEGDVVRRANENKRSAVSVKTNARSALCRNYNQWAVTALVGLKSRPWRDGDCANGDWRIVA